MKVKTLQPMLEALFNQDAQIKYRKPDGELVTITGLHLTKDEVILISVESNKNIKDD